MNGKTVMDFPDHFWGHSQQMALNLLCRTLPRHHPPYSTTGY